MSKSTINRAQRRKQQTRQKLLETTARILTEESYETLTVKAITEKADVGYGTFYLHFADKDDIVWQVTKTMMDEADKLLQAQFAHLPPLEREFEIMKLWFEISRLNKKNMLTVIGKNSSPTLSARYQDALVSTYVDRFYRNPDLERSLTVPLEFSSHFLTGALIHITAWWLESDSDYTAQQMTEFYFELMDSWGDWTKTNRGK